MVVNSRGFFDMLKITPRPKLCEFKEEKCCLSLKRGRIAKVSRSKKADKGSLRTQYVTQEDAVEEELGLYGDYSKAAVRQSQNTAQSRMTPARLHVSIIPEGLYLTKLNQHLLVKSKVILKTYIQANDLTIVELFEVSLTHAR